MLRVESIIFAPLIAALILSLVPSFDVRTRSSMSTFLQISWLALVAFFGFKGVINAIQLTLLAIHTLVLTGVKFHKNSSNLLPPMLWFLTCLFTVAILSTDPSTLLTFAYLHIALLVFVVLQTGGLYKGSSSYETFLFFTAIDLSALFALSLPYSWTYWVLLIPGLARILFPLTAPYARSLFVNCPTEIMLLMLGGTVPIGVIWLIQIPIACPYPSFLEIATFGSSFFAAILFLTEKSRRQRAIYLFMTQSALCVNLMLGANSTQIKLFGGLLCLVALVNSSIWLYFIEFPKIRFFNIAFAALTLFLLVYRP